MYKDSDPVNSSLDVVVKDGHVIFKELTEDSGGVYHVQYECERCKYIILNVFNLIISDARPMLMPVGKGESRVTLKC